MQKMGGIKNIDDSEKEYISGFEWINIKDIKNIKFYNLVDNVKIVKEALEKISNKQ